ncbi:type II toxin-antitoxin system RelE/ParE family toxin [Salinibacterium sp. SWN1162]|uniref:type II toxin-antitoxin system RelE/ParE family toxin n=1 Tax=Salinibacterium sp. SWN1162 TaxID=2792053 RepID=UPI0018CF4A3A|nr:type II toxin-antitoxin system RelE/ParE family toxin [Salinibacterium sp. SWN1162]MBH0009989.1 type II toxin-antitoxin system RelE/ParE family toxin [Salinibacterium sp. SWN1162]
MELQKWAYAVSARQQEYILKEAQKLGLSATAAVKMEAAMLRIEQGKATSSETSLVRGSVSEMRFQCDNRWYRLLYSRKYEHFVALHLIAKKQNKLDPGSIALAEKRHKKH